MIISRTPFRISFFGGGTDYPKWFEQHGGAVLGTAIDKYCYISVRNLPPFFEHKYRIVYSKIENTIDIKDIEHPAVRAVLQWMEIDGGLEIHHDGDLPARSGLGSSSSFTVGMINSLRALQGLYSENKDLARKAIHVEQNVIGEHVGSQDQVFAAMGGLNKITFHRDGDFSVTPIILPVQRKKMFNDHLMLFFTGFSRFASDIAKTKIDNFSKRETELKHMQSMVDDAISILADDGKPIDDFGKLLNETWQYKKKLSNSVSSPQIDEMYEAAMDAGALGGKILGAGGGGFLLVFARPEHQQAIRERLKKLVHVPFSFENEGTKIVLYRPDGL